MEPVATANVLLPKQIKLLLATEDMTLLAKTQGKRKNHCKENKSWHGDGWPITHHFYFVSFYNRHSSHSSTG